jgi:hypothetical protein
VVDEAVDFEPGVRPDHQPGLIEKAHLRFATGAGHDQVAGEDRRLGPQSSRSGLTGSFRRRDHRDDDAALLDGLASAGAMAANAATSPVNA